KREQPAVVLAEAITALIGQLVAAPGHPDLGPFYLLKGLLKGIQRLPWPARTGLLASLYMSTAGLLCAMWQERLPYRHATTTSSPGGGEDPVVDALARGEKEEGRVGVGTQKKVQGMGMLLANDGLYLRNKNFLKDVKELLGEVITAGLSELDELWVQGDLEYSPDVMGGDQARVAKLRYASLTLDFANQLVSTIVMDEKVAAIVISLVEGAARAGARGSGDRGGSASKGRGGLSAYFRETVKFLSSAAHSGLKRRESGNWGVGSGGGEGKEEGWVTVLQGLSGFEEQ
ncbi:unnamed protein product, partial [Discosporangium mesarthrocarpum]